MFSFFHLFFLLRSLLLFLSSFPEFLVAFGRFLRPLDVGFCSFSVHWLDPLRWFAVLWVRPAAGFLLMLF